MKNLGTKLDELNARDTEKRMTQRSKLTRRLVAPVAGIALLATGVWQGVEAAHKANEHSIEYLQDAPQKKDVVVESGDTANDLVNKFNEGGLVGQERQDVIEFVEDQGAVDAAGNHVLRAGQTVDVPEVVHQDK